MKPILALAVATAAFFAAGPVFSVAQSLPTLAADCGPVQGTIPVVDDALVTPDMAQVAEAEARDAALVAVPGATVVDIDLEEEDGFVVYEVDLLLDAVEVDVLVDAGSGAVLCTERD